MKVTSPRIPLRALLLELTLLAGYDKQQGHDPHFFYLYSERHIAATTIKSQISR